MKLLRLIYISFVPMMLCAVVPEAQPSAISEVENNADLQILEMPDINWEEKAEMIANGIKVLDKAIELFSKANKIENGPINLNELYNYIIDRTDLSNYRHRQRSRHRDSDYATPTQRYPYYPPPTQRYPDYSSTQRYPDYSPTQRYPNYPPPSQRFPDYPPDYQPTQRHPDYPPTQRDPDYATPTQRDPEQISSVFGAPDYRNPDYGSSTVAAPAIPTNHASYAKQFFDTLSSILTKILMYDPHFLETFNNPTAENIHRAITVIVKVLNEPVSAVPPTPPSNIADLLSSLFRRI